MIALLGTAATVSGIYCMMPQVIAVFKTKDVSALSLVMYIVMTIGKLLWMIYAIQISDLSLFAVNLVNLIQCAYILAAIVKYGTGKARA